MSFLKMIHYLYAALEDNAGGGVNRVSRELAKAGCRLSPRKVYEVLIDPIYVTGEWSVRVDDVLKSGRTIRLADPIPPEMFDRNQCLLEVRRGRNTRTPLGAFCLNHLELVHSRCLGQERDGLQARLRGRIQANTDSSDYAHSPWVPAQCHGFRVERGLLESALLPRVRDLADEPAVREAWERSAPSPPAMVLTPALDARQIRDTRQRLNHIRRQRAQLEQHFMDRLARGESVDERDYAELVGSVRSEIEQLGERLRLGQAPPPRVEIRKPDELDAALAEACGAEVPQDQGERARRANVVSAALSRVLLVDAPGSVDVRAECPALIGR